MAGAGVGVPIAPGVTTTPFAVVPCQTRYAESWQYAAYWCVSSLLYGTDDSGLMAQGLLTDSMGGFIKLGVLANKGQRIYNLTQGTDGLITAVTNTTVTATGVLWDTGDEYRLTTMTQRQESAVERYLESTAGRIHAALQSVDACDCTISTGGLAFLSDLNIRLAGIFHECPCGSPQLSADEKRLYLEDASGDLDAIRTGAIDVCAGETGVDYPAVGSASIGWTEFSQAEIIANRIRQLR